ncbi:immediate early response 2b [Brachyhypopomus gauderio]|uniref:immediate early response 2b n=1 Tax=Brachyhypopomus gauderio TaxID=698409 RepID=UPI0040429EEE
MDVRTEARRMMAVSISKLYTCRTQRGGLRLHRSLLLSTVIRSARDIYHSAVMMMDTGDQGRVPGDGADTSAGAAPLTDTHVPEAGAVQVPVGSETKERDEDDARPARDSRKRPGQAVAEPDFLPLKKARLETEDAQTRRTPLRTHCCWPHARTLSSLAAGCAIAAH